ncbi:MAG: HEAT repeat domain-containing protein [Planctomycetes bacterium]|nr:HEAT repeat domain-containing protein [Planctomycetota bacterium]MCB9905107.1 HEAT repeat domain-containing protein [Planctomycetota bacterium]
MFLRPFLICTIAALAAAFARPAAAAPQETVEAIMEAISRDRDEVNEALFRRLAEIGSEESLTALKKVPGMLSLQAKRDAACAAFAEYAGLDGLQEEAIAFLVSTTNAKQAGLRDAAAKGLARFEELAEDEMEELAKKSKDDSVRAYVCKALLAIWTERELDHKLRILLDASNVPQTGTHEELVQAFSRWDRQANTREFCDALGSRKTSSRLKRVVIDVIRDREFEEIDGALVDALKDKDQLTQYRALVALDARGSTEHESLLKRLANSDDEAVRRMAIISMARIDAADDGIAKKLEKYARDRDPSTRQGAVVALAALGTPEARGVIEDLLADEDRLVRLEAIHRLTDMRQKPCLPKLIARLDEETGRVRDEVANALRRLTGLDHGTSGQRWTRWWEGEGDAFELPTLEEALAAAAVRQENKDKGGTVASFYGLDVSSDRIAFVLDVSGSMNEDQGKGTRMDAARAELTKSLEKYPAGAWFNLIFFSTEISPWKEAMVKMDDFTRTSAIDYVSRQGPGGATAIYDALRLVFDDRDVDTIFLLTDGEPQGGTENDPYRIREEVLRWNLTRGIEIHCVSIGSESSLLRGLAEDSGGEYREVR